MPPQPSMPVSWAIVFVFSGPPRRPTAWARSPSSLFASGAGPSNTPTTAPGSPRSAPANSTTCTSRPATRSATPYSSKRNGVESVVAISNGPFIFLADVKDIRVEFREREVELGWSAPRGISDVRVIRKQGGPPKTPRDGDRLPAALDHALDRNLDPNEVYYYGIYAIYSMPDGRLFPAPGVVVSARPQPPITALEAPRLLQEPSGRVRIEWLEPARLGQDSAHRPPPLASGRNATDDRQALALEGQWLEPAAPDRAHDLEPPAEGHCYYTPMTAWGDSWTVGHGVALSRVSDPTDLRATPAGSGLGAPSGTLRLTLRWRWAAEAAASIVLARQGTPPQGPNDPAALSATVTHADYHAHDCWTLNLPLATRPGTAIDNSAVGTRSGPDTGDDSTRSENGAWNIRVYSVIDLDGVRSISPGLEPTAAMVLPGPNPEVTVSYALKRPWLPGLPWSVAFRTEPPGAAVPPMVLVAHPRAVPLAVDDGQIVARFPRPRWRPLPDPYSDQTLPARSPRLP